MEHITSLEAAEMELKRKVWALDAVISYVTNFQPHMLPYSLEERELTEVLNLLENEKRHLNKKLLRVRRNMNASHYRQEKSTDSVLLHWQARPSHMPSHDRNII
jgi:hypothetical protein